MPDISLLVPLAEQLNVTVAELLQGRRVEEEQRFTREETEDLIRKALTFSAEPPERRQARTKKYLPVYVICCVLGVAEALAVWAAGLADIEGALALLIIGVVFGVVYGAVFVERATGWQVWGAVLVVYIASLFGAIVIPAKRFE